MRLERIVATTHGVFGRLRLPDGTVLYTCEEEARGNQPRVSCIPAGTYTCKRRRSEKFNMDVYEVENVPGRSAILIHPGNTTEDTEGCILPGLSIGVLDIPDDAGNTEPRLSVLSSRIAFARLLRAGGDSFTLTITDPVR